MGTQLVVLTIVAFVTAAISAITGMAGGILLLSAMFIFMPHAAAVPVHAVVQLVSNSTRIVAYINNVDWVVFRRFLTGAIPGALLSVLLLIWIGQLENSEPYLKTLIGVYVLTAAHLPKPKKAAEGGGRWDWTIMGLVAGASALLVGAVGPLIAPLFARRAFVKERLIATKATCQMLLHLCKIPAFAYLNLTAQRGDKGPLFALHDLGLLALVMASATIPGTLFGKRLLRYVSERQFVVLFKIALTLAGLKVLWFDGLKPLLV